MFYNLCICLNNSAPQYCIMAPPYKLWVDACVGALLGVGRRAPTRSLPLSVPGRTSACCRAHPSITWDGLTMVGPLGLLQSHLLDNGLPGCSRGAHWIPRLGAYPPQPIPYHPHPRLAFLTGRQRMAPVAWEPHGAMMEALGPGGSPC